MPKFSIIIPVYNVAPYLRECLDSVLAQTFADWEAICVDDGSTDGSGAILDEYAVRDGRFRVIHQANAGVSAARNAALDAAKGEWFLFLDGDDMFRPDALEHFSQVIGGNRCDAILVQPYCESLSRDEVVKTEPFEVIQQMQNGVHLMTGEISANGYVMGRVYKTKVFGTLRFQVGVGMSEDVLFWSKAIGVPAEWVAVKGSYYFYRQREGSACRQYDFKHYAQIINVNLQVLRQLMDNERTGDAAKWYWRRYRWSCEQVKNSFGHWCEFTRAQRRCILSYQSAANEICKSLPFSFDFKLAFLMHRANLHFVHVAVVFALRVMYGVKRRVKCLIKGGNK